MSRAQCANERCTRLAMKHEAVTAKLGPRAITGMCPLHTIRAVTMLASRNLANLYNNPHDPAPLTEWVAAARASGTLSVGDLTVYEVTLAELAEVTGVAPKTIADIAAGVKQYVQKGTCAKLAPWIEVVDPSPRGVPIKTGHKYGQQAMTYAPLGTTVLDDRGRAWQLRGRSESPKWCPAHLKRYDTPVSLDRGPAWPVRVLYLPAFMFTRTTY